MGRKKKPRLSVDGTLRKSSDGLPGSIGTLPTVSPSEASSASSTPRSIVHSVRSYGPQSQETAFLPLLGERDSRIRKLGSQCRALEETVASLATEKQQLVTENNSLLQQLETLKLDYSKEERRQFAPKHMKWAYLAAGAASAALIISVSSFGRTRVFGI